MKKQPCMPRTRHAYADWHDNLKTNVTVTAAP
jgi:hypothetical protein